MLDFPDIAINHTACCQKPVALQYRIIALFRIEDGLNEVTGLLTLLRTFLCN
jgi:hypothetical protein